MTESYTDQPPPHDPRRDEGYSPTRRPRDRDPEPDDEGDAPRLGSLAQKARGKQLKQARSILIAIGALTIVFNLIDLLQFQSNLGKGAARPDPTMVLFVYAFDGGFIAMGVLFVIFGILIHRFPVPATVISLVLYLLGTVITLGLLATQGGTVFMAGVTTGLLFRVLIIAGLAGAIKSAVAYEREKRESDDFGPP